MGLETLNNLGVKHPFKAKYDNYIGGKFVPPADGKYFENISPVTGKVFCEVARSNEKDINLALDAAHAAKDGWAKKSPTERANLLMQIADIMEKIFQRLQSLKRLIMASHFVKLPMQIFL